MRATRSRRSSVNHKLPSEPAVIPKGTAPDAVLNSVMPWASAAGANRPSEMSARPKMRQRELDMNVTLLVLSDRMGACNLGDGQADQATRSGVHRSQSVDSAVVAQSAKVVQAPTLRRASTNHHAGVLAAHRHCGCSIHPDHVHCGRSAVRTVVAQLAAGVASPALDRSATRQRAAVACAGTAKLANSIAVKTITEAPTLRAAESRTRRFASWFATSRRGKSVPLNPRGLNSISMGLHLLLHGKRPLSLDSAQSRRPKGKDLSPRESSTRIRPLRRARTDVLQDRMQNPTCTLSMLLFADEQSWPKIVQEDDDGLHRGRREAGQPRLRVFSADDASEVLSRTLAHGGFARRLQTTVGGPFWGRGRPWDASSIRRMPWAGAVP
jgi:hypothetical protein